MNDKELVLELTKLALLDFPMSERKKIDRAKRWGTRMRTSSPISICASI